MICFYYFTVILASVAASVATGPADTNPLCPTLSRNEGCAQADVAKYCPESCQAKSQSCCTDTKQKLQTLENVVQASLASIIRNVTELENGVTSAQTELSGAAEHRANISTEVAAVAKCCSNNQTATLLGFQSQLQQMEDKIQLLTSFLQHDKTLIDSMTKQVQALEQQQARANNTSVMIDTLTRQVQALQQHQQQQIDSNAWATIDSLTNQVQALQQQQQMGANTSLAETLVNKTELCDKVDQCPKTHTPAVPPVVHPFDCGDVLKLSGPGSGVFTIRGHPAGPTDVYCEDGYTYLMKRTDDSLSFSRPLKELASGLGKPDDMNFWIGLEAMHYLTTTRRYKLMVEVTDKYNSKLRKSATYSEFLVGTLSEDYAIAHSGICTGDGCDGLDMAPSGTRFSTTGRDVDTHRGGDCTAYFYGAGFWYSDCGSSLTAPFCGYQKNSFECAIWRSGTTVNPYIYISSAIMKIAAIDP